MATLKEKIDCERRMRELIATEGLPEPSRVEYGYTCIRLFWDTPKVAIVVDIDPPPEGYEDEAGDLVEAEMWLALGQAEAAEEGGEDGLDARNN